MDTLKEYREYLKTLNLTQLHDIASHIDKEAFPEKYKLVIKLIQK